MQLHLFDVLRVLSKDLGLNSSDVTYLVKRLKNESTQFVTSTLPKLWKNVMFSLKLGYFYRECEAAPLTCFAWKGRSLRYFRSLLDRIFDPKTGILLEDADPKAIRGLRQLSEYFYKLCTSFTDSQMANAEARYLDFEEQELPLRNEERPSWWTERLRKNFETYYRPLSTATPSDVFSHTRPRFGPGSFSINSVDWKQVYERARSSAMGENHPFGPKTGHIPYWLFKQLPDEVIGLCPPELAPYAGFFKPYKSTNCNGASKIYARQKRVCEVLFVPKNADAPRVISREPPHFLKAQMSFFGWASATLERVTEGRIQFTDQTVNRALAKQGSIDGSLSTLDLKDASDSVSMGLVRSIFRNSPAMRFFVHKTRSTHAKLPSGRRFALEKMSGMGSGLTFPIMSLLIHLSVCSEISRVHDVDFKQAMRRVYTFGDDLIVPTAWSDCAIQSLNRTGFRVNVGKSFTTGRFRESCGGDYFDGTDVSPVRLKLMSARLATAREIGFVLNLRKDEIFLIERHARELCSANMLNTARYIYSRIENVLGPLPPAVGDTPYLARFDELGNEASTVVSEYSPRTLGSGVGLTRHLDAYLPQPIKTDAFSRYLCPYKYLSTKLRGSGDEIYQNLAVTRFGELSVPHAVTLKKQRVSVNQLDYTVPAPLIELRSAGNGLAVEYKFFARIMQLLYIEKHG